MSSIDFYDKSGEAFGYIDQNQNFFSWSGDHIGFVKGDDLYQVTGRWIGFIKNGYIFDENGQALLFSNGATGGPLPPISSIPPIKSIPSIPSINSIPEIVPIHPMSSLSWSGSSPELVFKA